MKTFINKITLSSIKIKFYKYWAQYKNNKLKLKIIKYLSDTFDYEENEKEEIINFLKNNPLPVFPYNFTKKYKFNNIAVYIDPLNEMKYIIQDNKRLYFKKKWDENRVKRCYRNLLIEQDIDSPHKYESEDFYVEKDDIVVDAGAAEGYFALSIIEKAKKIYLFEIDEEWIEALQATFDPWKEKVIIVNKYVSDNDDNGCITLNTIFENKKIDFIKADIEGAEMALLRGSQNILLNNKKLKIILCTYHKQTDAEELNRILLNNGFKTEFSKGYMIFLYDKTLQEPYLRKVIIRGRK